MAVTGLDHVNIRTGDLPATIAFYEQALGLTYRAGPEVMGHRPHWLCDDGGQAVIHLRAMAPDGSATGALDHVALRCRDLAAAKARLDRAGASYAERHIAALGVTQVVLRDPNGIALELSFPDA